MTDSQAPNALCFRLRGDACRGSVLLSAVGAQASCRKPFLWGRCMMVPERGAPISVTQSVRNRWHGTKRRRLHLASPAGHLPPKRKLAPLLSFPWQPFCFLFSPQAAVCSDWPHWNAVPSSHIRCRITARRRATATTARFMPRRLATRSPQAFSAHHFLLRVSRLKAAS